MMWGGDRSAASLLYLVETSCFNCIIFSKRGLPGTRAMKYNDRGFFITREAEYGMKIVENTSYFMKRNKILRFTFADMQIG